MMSLNFLISIVLAGSAAGTAIGLVMASRRSLADHDIAIPGKYPRGYWTGVGISFGAALGSAIGIVLENIGIGILLGIPIGTGIGMLLEEQFRESVRPLTEQEQRKWRWSMMIGIITPLVLMGILIMTIFLLSRSVPRA
jgi:hypothetical protein